MASPNLVANVAPSHLANRPAGRHPAKEVDLTAVEADVRAGMKPEALRQKYGIGWGRAKRLYDRFADPSFLPAAAEPDDPDAAWELTLELRPSHAATLLDHSRDAEIIAALRQCSIAARMECAACILQARIDREIVRLRAGADLSPITANVLAEADPRPSTSPTRSRGNYAQA